MGWMQKCCETYENNRQAVGMGEEGSALCPPYFIYKKADISITLREDGSFYGAKKLVGTEQNTLIPATEKSSSGRTRGIAAHPLCEELSYAAFGHPASPVSQEYSEKYQAYHTLLAQWATHPQYSHYIVRAVLKYIEGGTIVEDLRNSGLFPQEGDALANDRMEEKRFVRWQVIKAQTAGGKCWADQTLFHSFAQFYEACLAQGQEVYCYATGQRGKIATLHPKGVVSSQNGAKLLSANDDSGFTYRGRFYSAEEAYAVTMQTTQEAHSALRWLVANQGTQYGSRTFVMWNSMGVPVEDANAWITNAPLGTMLALTQTQYREQLNKLFQGYRKPFEDVSDQGVQVIALDAATKGRMSVTYYSELFANDFFDRIEAWYEKFCWWRRRFDKNGESVAIVSPSPYRLILFAFGVERAGERVRKMEIDEQLIGELLQEIMGMIFENKKFPYAYVKRLVDRCSVRTGYSAANYEELLFVACASIQKYVWDATGKEVSMQLDTNETNRSYLFGRLLAVAEKIERSGFSAGEERMTNAERMQAVFVQRPMDTWRNLELALKPYLARMKGGLRDWYKSLLDDIFAKIEKSDVAQLQKPLKEEYLLGYHLQRKALYTKKEQQENQENQD